jgi:hypothetical protein
MTNESDANAQSFNDRITQAVENIVRPLHGVLEKELASLVNELATAIASQRTAALAQAGERAAAEKDVAVTAAVAAAKADHEIVMGEMTRAAAAERDAAMRAAEMAAESAAATAVTEALSRAQADADAAMAAARDDASRRLDTLKAEAERTLSDRLADADARAATTLETSLTGALASERQADIAWVARLLETVRMIDEARSMSDVLNALAGQEPGEPGRVAIFLVRDGKLRGWRFTGFENVSGEPRDLELAVDASDVIARAVAGRDCAATSDRGVQPAIVAPPPGSLLHLPQGRAGFAAPVCVAGHVVAVVYADEGGVAAPRVPNAWPEIVEISARHAGRCLELLMAARIAVLTQPADIPAAEAPGREPAPHVRAAEEEDAARRYARLLISEIKLYHESDVNQGKREQDLLQRLRPEIDRARRLYEERVSPDVRTRTDCFEEELVRTLADGDARLLGQAT